MNPDFDKALLDLALRVARISKDPSTKVGAVLTRNADILITAYNRFPFPMKEDERLENRDFKLDHIVHAEEGCLMAAARVGIRTNNSTLYVAATTGTDLAWGGPPCIRCTVSAIEAGVITFVSYPMKLAPSRWHESINKAKAVIAECELEYREVEI
jgi:dCMP deaminase